MKIKPEHIAIIMDGNGRWAKNLNKTRRYGHQQGASSAKNIVKEASSIGVKYLTLYAFSTENWGRPSKEVELLMRLFLETLEKEIDELNENNVRIRFIGDRKNLKDKLITKINNAESITKNNNGLKLYVALAYGAKWDIVNAVTNIFHELEKGMLTKEDIDEITFSKFLQLKDAPDPDLLVRTGGEKRISNFLLWNIAYSELYFCDCLWPDFDKNEFERALEFFASRKRRFGVSTKSC